MRVKRIDIGQLEKPVFRNDGTAIVQARLARTGVQTYRNDDGTPRREYRPEPNVFGKRTMDSYKMLPFTNDHPPVMITADNAKQYMVGATGQDIHQDGKWLVGTIAVYDARTVQDMRSGKVQISGGYDCDLEMTPGVSPDGEHYDCVQTNIEGNHFALVWNARAGEEAAARMDAAAVFHYVDNNKGGSDMTLEQALAELAKTQQQLGAATARADAADRDLKDAKKRCDTLEAERDTAKDAATKAEQARKDTADRRDAEVNERVELLSKCTAVLGSKLKRADGAEVELSKIADRDLKLALIKHVTQADCANGSDGKPRSMDYINARYDAAIEQAAVSADTFRGAHDFIESNREDFGDSQSGAQRKDVADAYTSMVRDNRHGWEQGAGYSVAQPSKK